VQPVEGAQAPEPVGGGHGEAGRGAPPVRPAQVALFRAVLVQRS
jgi:hypothetical protein